MMAECVALPQKRYYRQRAHSNPLSDHTFDYPTSPSCMDWSTLYPPSSPVPESENSPSSPDPQLVRFVDIGCGYGGLLIKLASLYPDTRILGMEIRVKVSDYVKDRIEALRQQHPNHYLNVGVIRTNAMKYLPNYFIKGQLSKMFFLFPDPHFKKSKHKWRIITPLILSEYAYVLQIGGLVYIATDVNELHEWMVKCFVDHPLFVETSLEEKSNDVVVPLLDASSEEGIKVARNKGSIYKSVFRRIKDPFLES